MRYWSICFTIVGLFTTSVMAKGLIMPETDRQQIKFWLPYIVSQQNADAISAQQVFSRLLNTWDQSRVEPELVIVKTTDGPWAASLADGHILINTSALKTVKKIEPEYHQDALAFILAHELSHQKNDDLWHQRFFRVNHQNPDKIPSQGLKERRLKEMQADQDGLTMMTVVGFNPVSITRGKGFFTAWLETNRRFDCENQMTQSTCEFAQRRADNAKRQISQIVQQKIWYDLAFFLLANKQFEKARQYFLTFAKEFPHWVVYNTIAVSYLLEASQNAGNSNYYLSLNQLQLDKLKPLVSKRSASIKRDRKKLLAKAFHYLNKSDHLQPDNPETLYLLSLSYILSHNIPMAKGILEGKLIVKEKMTGEMVYLRALINRHEGDFLKAEKNLLSAKKLINNSHYLNLAILEQQLAVSRNPAKTQQRLNLFVDKQIISGDSIAFRWGLSKINPEQDLMKNNPVFVWPSLTFPRETNNSIHTLWMQGEPYSHITKANYHTLAKKQNEHTNPIYRWCVQPNCFTDKTIDSKARLLATYGLPQRIQHIAGADYMVYTKSGFIAMLDQQKIEKIFQIKNEN